MKITGDVLERILRAIVYFCYKMCRSFFMLDKINFGHVLKMRDFGKRYFTATMTEGKKK